MWTIRHSEYIHRSPWTAVKKDTIQTEIRIEDFYVLEYSIWVNMIAIHLEATEDTQVDFISKRELFVLMQNGKIVEGIILTPLWQYFYEYGIQ